MSAEFVDPERERQFLLHHLDATAQRLRTTGLIGSGTCLVFTVADLANLGVTPTFVFLLALRSALFVATVIFTAAVGRTPALALDTKLITALEAATMAVLFVVMAYRPTEVGIHNLGIAVTIVAYFLLIPNRFTVVLALTTTSVVAYVVVGSLMFDQAASQQIANGLTIAAFLGIGALSANQLQRARRDEYLALLQERDSNDRLSGEISRRRVLEDELTWMATHDPLTDLLNRRAFYEHAEREAARARRANLPMSILVIDADEFKGVNDRFGHHAGDEALRRISAICKLHLRADDVVGRIGGEEFAAIMPGANRALAEQVAERLRAAVVASPIEHAEGDIELSISVGVTEYRLWQESMVDGIQRADEAMYLAKTAGRNCVVPV